MQLLIWLMGWIIDLVWNELNYFENVLVRGFNTSAAMDRLSVCLSVHNYDMMHEGSSSFTKNPEI